MTINWANDSVGIALIDAMPGNVAVVGLDGEILRVNAAWNAFARSNGGNQAAVSVGSNYFAVCKGAAGAGDPTATTVGDMLKAVLCGARPEAVFDYPCHSKTKRRWFSCCIRPLHADGQIVAALVSHQEQSEHAEKIYQQGQLLSAIGGAMESENECWWDWCLESDALQLSESFRLSLGLGDALPLSGARLRSILDAQAVRALDTQLQSIRRGAQRDINFVFSLSISGRQQRWFRQTGVALRRPDGLLERIVGIIRDITEVQRGEQERDLLWQVVNSAPVGIVVSDAGEDCPIRYVNPAGAAMTGYAPEFLKEKNLRFLQGPDREQPGLTTIRNAIKRKEPAEATIRNYRRDGAPYWVRLNIAPMKGWGDQVTHFVGIQEDVTAEVEAIAARDQAAAALRDLYRKTPAMLHSIDSEGRLLDVSDRWLERLGYDRDAVVGRPSTDFLTEASRDFAKTTVLPAFFRDGRVSDVPYQFVCKSGEIVDVRLSGVLHHDRDGEKPRSLAFLADVTEEKRAEAEARLYKERIEDFVKTAAEIYFEQDQDGVIRYLTYFDGKHNALNIPGLVGKKHEETDPDGVSEEQWRVYHTAIATGEPFRDFRFSRVLADGRRHYFSRSGVPFYDANGRFAGHRGSVRIITPIIEYEFKLQEQIRRAVQSEKTKTKFLHRVSHELRTPLNAIIGFGQLLEAMPEAMTDKQLGWVRGGLNGGYKLLELVDRILDLTSLERDETKQSVHVFNASPVISSCILRLDELTASRKVTVHNMVDNETLPLVEADPNSLERILTSLLSNAVQYNRPGGEVWITAQPRGTGQLVIKVRDNGPGVPWERRRELFAPLSRLGMEFSAIDGAGMDLAISKQLAERMGCEIGISDDVVSGAQFWVAIPLADIGLNPCGMVAVDSARSDREGQSNPAGERIDDRSPLE